jgi:hypothetical protein
MSDVASPSPSAEATRATSSGNSIFMGNTVFNSHTRATGWFKMVEGKARYIVQHKVDPIISGTKSCLLIQQFPLLMIRCALN